MKDLDLLVVMKRGSLASLRLEPPPLRTLNRGDRRWSMLISDRPRPIQVDLFMARPAELPFALFHLTGPRLYNIRIRAYARRRGWILNQYGLFYANDPTRRVRGSSRIQSEADLARFLGVTVRAPSQR